MFRGAGGPASDPLYDATRLHLRVMGEMWSRMVSRCLIIEAWGLPSRQIPPWRRVSWQQRSADLHGSV